MPILAVDFGTSNSAAAVLDQGRPRRIRIEPQGDTLPTAVFFPEDTRDMLIGNAAGDALVAGEDGQYMRALKSVLGTSLLHENRRIGLTRRTLSDVITAFLVQVKHRAEAQTGQVFDHVLSGRPVHFHSSDAARDQRAKEDLRACYQAAGFAQVDFLPEPEAAARASLTQTGGALGLIVDIGGGTSDFSVFRQAKAGVEILASHGIRLGGTDFDHALSMTHVMPHLGLGGQLRRSFGEGLLPVPRAIYVELSTWARIPFLYTRETARAVADMQMHAVSPVAMDRLARVIDNQSGHDLAFAAERGKIAANAGDTGATIDMSQAETGLTAHVDAASMAAALAGYTDALQGAMQQTLSDAGVAPDRIGSVVLVGGSSLMAMVESAAQDLCPKANMRRSDAFTAVVDGLALATGELQGSPGPT